MKLLVLGGTQLVGRHFVEGALAAGHRVTLFNRGLTNAALFPGVPRITGDRESLDVPGAWDAVVDVCGYHPAQVRRSVEALAGRVGRYVYVSTISVYAGFGAAPITEDCPLELGDEGYGAEKARCEEIVRDGIADHTILRLGLVAGPYDHTDRLTSWVRRIAQGGDVLAPGRPWAPLQFVDARDVGRFALRAIERGLGGTMNVVGPREPLSWGRFFELCRDVTGSDARFVWVDEERLRQHQIAPWTDLPLWMPDRWSGAHRVEHGRAVAAGMVHRRPEETLRDAWAFDRTRPADAPRTGLPAERERAILAAR